MYRVTALTRSPAFKQCFSPRRRDFTGRRKFKPLELHASHSRSGDLDHPNSLLKAGSLVQVAPSPSVSDISAITIIALKSLENRAVVQVTVSRLIEVFE